MNTHSETWTFDHTVLQAPFSNVCGHYCVYFWLYKSRGFTMSEIVSRFSKKLFENDRSVAHLVLNLQTHENKHHGVNMLVLFMKAQVRHRLAVVSQQQQQH